jgi:hypothetical protein
MVIPVLSFGTGPMGVDPIATSRDHALHKGLNIGPMGLFRLTFQYVACCHSVIQMVGVRYKHKDHID